MKCFWELRRDEIMKKTSWNSLILQYFGTLNFIEFCVTKIRQERNVVVILSALKNTKTNTTREFFSSRIEGKIFMRRGNFFQFATKFWRHKGEKSFLVVGKFDFAWQEKKKMVKWKLVGLSVKSWVRYVVKTGRSRKI